MLIEIKNLSYSYPDGQNALKDISLTVSKGEKIAILGSNGAGKSTLLLHLNGILRGNGTVAIDGEELTDISIKRVRRKVGLIFQDPNDQLFCPTVRDDVSFGPIHFGISQDEIDAIVSDVLNQVDMKNKAHRAPHHLSLGERRRVSFAAVLACKPLILALDEPAAMLDPKRKREIIDFILKTDKTVIIATHEPQFALETTSRCIIMSEGKIAMEGKSSEILKDTCLLNKYGL